MVTPVTLQEFMVSGVFAFLVVFVRIGTAFMIMPGIGDSFVPQNVRLYIALGLSLVLSPLVASEIPFNGVPALPELFVLIMVEFVTGLFIGTVARIFMVALDTAGMLISISSGLANAQVFNPSLASQGSIAGAFLSITGVTVLFASDLHHLLIQGLVDSYHNFPVGEIPESGSMSQLIARAVSASFLTGFQVGIPFIVVSLMVYIGMGVLSRLMPQIQVFMLALPVQILLSLVTLSLVISAGMLFWLSKFEDGMVFFLSLGAGG